MPSNTSAGVTAREIDQSGQTSPRPVGVPAAIISPTEKGPAFVPCTVPNMPAYVDRFGSTTADHKVGPLAANEWLSFQPSLTQVRILGAGDGTQRTSSGLNRGKVTNAGFVVGSRIPQSSLSGGLGNNTFANATSAGGAVASTGRTFFLSSFMSQSAGSTFISDAYGSATGNILRGILMAASGVLLSLSASNAQSVITASAAPDPSVPSSIQGFHTGSVNLNQGKQEFIMLLNGHKGSVQYPYVITGSFDVEANNYFASVFNTDPLKLEQAGHLLYAYFDIHPSLATVTGSSFVTQVSGAAGLGAGYENIAMLVTSSLARNSGSATVPNFEGFEDRYQTARSPWVISQKFGGAPVDLFRVWALSDGKYPNDKVKLSIENISPSNSDTTNFGSFDLLVRSLADTDANKLVLESFKNLSLDSESDRFIAKIIGDAKRYYNFDATTDKQGLVEEVEYENNSNLIRVELSQDVLSGEVDPTALPMGFRGSQHLVTSGSAVFSAFSDSTYLVASNPLNSIVQPPVPMRLSLAKGATPNQTADRNLYWGVQFEKVVNATQPNYSTQPNKSIAAFNQYYPTYQLDYMNMVVRDNHGVADTTANGVLDADRFCNNLFSLEKIKLAYRDVADMPADTSATALTTWSYVRAGNVSTDTGALTRALTVSDLLDSSVRNVAKFSFFLEGGFDGVSPFNREINLFSNKAVLEEMTNTSRGLTNGPTVQSYLKAIDIVKDVTELEIQLLTIPGIRHSYITDTAIRAVEGDHVDAMFIMDIQERDSGNLIVTNDTQTVNVKNTAQDFRNRGLNSSFTAAYFPDVVIRDSNSRVSVRVPPSVAVLGAFAKNDAIGHPWYAPAGFARGSLTTTDRTVVELSKQNMNDLAAVNINPLVAFVNSGPVVWGQRTALSRQSAFDRVNVRRLMISLRRSVRKVANKILFEQNREETLNKFASLVNPILKRVQDQKGLEFFSVQINTQTTTAADVENKTIRGKIFVVPTKTLEFLSLDFVITNQGASITGS